VSGNKYREAKQLTGICLLNSTLPHLLLSALLICSLSYASEESPLPVVKMSPKMRGDEQPVLRFSTIPCDQLTTINPYTPDEQRALAQRKKECLAQFQQFIPNKALR
jgi:hypothetical protein